MKFDTRKALRDHAAAVLADPASKPECVAKAHRLLAGGGRLDDEAIGAMSLEELDVVMGEGRARIAELEEQLGELSADGDGTDAP